MADVKTARVTINDENEDQLFRIFDAAQGLERRVFRMLARGFFNEHGVDELRRQAEGLMQEIAEMAAEAARPKSE